MNTILKQNGFRFGLILGVALFIPSLIGVYININYMVSNYIFLTVLLTTIFLGILAIGYGKRALYGNISFKECFTTYFVMILIGLLVQGAFNYVFFNTIETDFSSKLKTLQIENYEEAKIKISTSEKWIQEEKDRETKRINTTIEATKKGEPYALSSILKGSIMFIGIFSIFGLFLSLLLKTPQKQE